MNREGYLMVDHRASPGIPADLARIMGMNPAEVGAGSMYECGTMTCAHCRGVVAKNKFRIRERGNCLQCGNAYICDGCHAESKKPEYTHNPFEKRVDAILDNASHSSLILTP